MALTLRRSLTCQQLVELVSDYLEGTLDRRTRRAFDRHLAGCLACPAYVEQLRTTVRLLGRAPTPSVRPEALARLEAAFRDARNERPGSGD